MAKKELEQVPVCDHCGAALKEWWHRLTPGLVELLLRSIVHVKMTGMNIIKKNDVCDTVSQACNYNKLRYFGLIARARDEMGDSIDGVFVLTVNAGRFLRGELEMPVKVKTYRNELVEKSSETVSINKFRGRYPWFDAKGDYEFDIHEGKVVQPNYNPQGRLL